ncbi:MAG: SH3 domain-containing protein, partial [Dehalococcoidia bacterium]
PSTAANVLTLLAFGTAVDISGTATADGWYPANAAGRQGFVNGSYLDFSTPRLLKGDAVVAPSDGAHLRDAPALAGNVVATLPAGRLVHIVADPTGDGWYPVQTTEGSGWVDGAYLQAATADAQSIVIRWYGHEFDGGVLACGGVFSADDAGVAAANGWPCGTHLKVCAAGHCVAVTVRDRGHMGLTAIDLSAAAFQKLASLDVGALSGTLQLATDGVSTP